MPVCSINKQLSKKLIITKTQIIKLKTIKENI